MVNLTGKVLLNFMIYEKMKINVENNVGLKFVVLGEELETYYVQFKKGTAVNDILKSITDLIP